MVWLVPRAEQSCRVPAQDEEQLIVGMSSVQLLHRIRGVGQAASFDLHVGNLETRLVLCREAHHGEAVGFGCQGRRTMRRSTAGDEQHAVEVCTVQRRFGRGEVPKVDRIERAAQDAQPHALTALLSTAPQLSRGLYAGFIPAVTVLSSGY